MTTEPIKKVSKRRRGAKYLGPACFANHQPPLRYCIGGACVQCMKEHGELAWKKRRVNYLRAIMPVRVARDSGMQEKIDECAPLIHRAAALLLEADSLTRRGVWWAALAAHGVDKRLARLLKAHGRARDDSWLG
jgi:hypothetical protein